MIAWACTGMLGERYSGLFIDTCFIYSCPISNYVPAEGVNPFGQVLTPSVLLCEWLLWSCDSLGMYWYARREICRTVL